MFMDLLKKKALMVVFVTKSAFENIYFSEQDAVKIVTNKNSADFHTIP